jgi:DNA polymerase-3 subunit epsilon
VNFTQSIVFIDVETTGFDPVKDRIIQFGAVALKPDGTTKLWTQKFNPGISIPPASTECHHITDEDVKDCPPFEEFATRITAGLNGRVIAGYNPWRLDLPIIDEELRRYGCKLDMASITVIDCWGIFCKKDGRSLEDAVRKFCGHELSDAHDALEDAKATMEVLQGQLRAFPDLEALDIKALSEFSRVADNPYVDMAGKLYRDKDGDVCYAFGKSRGVKMRDDPGFADWILSKDFPGSTREAIMAEFTRMAELSNVGH